MAGAAANSIRAVPAMPARNAQHARHGAVPTMPSTPQLLRALSMALAVASAGAGAETPEAACTLAYQPYSSRTILADLLQDPLAKAVLQREAPQLAQFVASVLPPAFATILNPQLLLAAEPAATREHLDHALAQVAVTDAAARARCSRYDRSPPALPEHIARPALLVFDKTTGFRDSAAIDAAAAALRSVAARRGWTLVFTDKGAVFNPRDLQRFDAVVWNNTSGDALTVPQQDAFKTWLLQGGGYVGLHSAGGDPVFVWDWYADTLIGARFTGHPVAPQFQPGTVRVDSVDSAITQGVAATWTMTDEWYSFAASPRAKGARILLTLDESSYAPVGIGGGDLRMGADHALVWTQCLGNGRSFYSAIGHLPASYVEPNSARLMAQGMAWAAGLGSTGCDGGREAPTRSAAAN
jgi:type 1 glutamine amidotransferase